jgi:hypothetical protein
MAEVFAADWLSLREPADHAARPQALLDRLQGALPDTEPLQVVDLGAGSGSNLRYLGPRLDRRQHWRLIDHDAGLLDAVTGCEGIAFDTWCTSLEAFPPPDLPPPQLVTASALLDLVTERWLARLVDYCIAHECPALFALSVDGRIELDPPADDDDRVLAALQSHQNGPKAMGTALGTAAPARAAALFRRHDYRVRSMPSDWRLTPREGALQHQLLVGWHAAVIRQSPGDRHRFDDWLQTRIGMLDRTHIRVGHQDLLAWP